ncbi:RNA polymerase sigma factor [candidate division KSB1 bacterium]|nr:RNA polymerase sigma factor [candidate division KSB1 bacterium]
MSTFIEPNYQFDMNDNELIQKIAQNDQMAFKMLVDRYNEMVINVCYHFCGNKQDAEDVSQEVFIQVYKSAPNYRFEAKLSSWIYRIAVNRSLNNLRTQKRMRWFRRINDFFDEDRLNETTITNPVSPDQPDIAFSGKEQRQIINKAIDSLPEDQKVAFMLHQFEGLSYQEISEIMQKSLSSVTSIIHRAKLNLQKKLVKILKEG